LRAKKSFFGKKTLLFGKKKPLLEKKTSLFGKKRSLFGEKTFLLSVGTCYFYGDILFFEIFALWLFHFLKNKQ